MMQYQKSKRWWNADLHLTSRHDNLSKCYKSRRSIEEEQTTSENFRKATMISKEMIGQLAEKRRYLKYTFVIGSRNITFRF